MKVIQLSHDEIASLRQYLAGDDVYAVEVAVDYDCFKVKVNGAVWSPPMGRVKP